MSASPVPPGTGTTPVPLPQDPDLGQLRARARELQRAVRAGDAAARARAARWHPRPPAPPEAFPLTAAQLVIAREHGFAGWSRLLRHVRIVTAAAWTPGRPAPAGESPADRFLRLACLTYGDDRPARREAAARLLADHPHLPADDLFVAAACADTAAVRRHLAESPAQATRAGGPYGWSPLLYQAYARHDPHIGLAATLETARALLVGGADPDDGRFWHGLPTPFTVLTGVLGHGEAAQPPHPHAVALARLLLDAGADPNDGQALYHQRFAPDDDQLALLLAHGLGRGTPRGPWHRLLGTALPSPARMLRDLLPGAVAHDRRARVTLLAAHGVDVFSPLPAENRTPAEFALLHGHRALAAHLVTLGARPARLSPADAFTAAALAADAAAVRSAPPDVVAEARRTRPGLLTWAAAHGAPGSVDLLRAAGFDVNALGPTDSLTGPPRLSPLHVAAHHGDLPLARTLLALGADPAARDADHAATPLAWARHAGHTPLIALLREP